MTSSPWSQWLHPVLRITCRLPLRLTAFCSCMPVQKKSAPPSHTATSGVMCGRPSARTVVIQNSSACSSARRVCSHPVAAAAGSLNLGSRLVTGVVTASPLPVVRRWRAAGGPAVLLLAQTDVGPAIHRRGGAAGGEQGGGSHARQPHAFPGEVRLVGVSQQGRGRGQ